MGSKKQDREAIPFHVSLFTVVTTLMYLGPLVMAMIWWGETYTSSRSWLDVVGVIGLVVVTIIGYATVVAYAPTVWRWIVTVLVCSGVALGAFVGLMSPAGQGVYDSAQVLSQAILLVVVAGPLLVFYCRLHKVKRS